VKYYDLFNIGISIIIENTTVNPSNNSSAYKSLYKYKNRYFSDTSWPAPIQNNTIKTTIFYSIKITYFILYKFSDNENYF